ncbi:MAG: hypothetical protein DMG64_03580 [Acidobacteria bacterium]|nr:MAG: hypothetical protein DMG63_13910 [Acidobacteriota bacterium]PYY05112.1 MAG: hypothetical protein DMG64_03580 [Acidobacteriota bacterium]PYY24673.1 MAG: hypothetical protein DMG62_02095 [Acidobacteriota bacterium]
MCERLRERGWEFEVWFMGHSEPERHWPFERSEFKFHHRFLSGKRFQFGSLTLYWNPEINNLQVEVRPDILLVAGAWIHPTVLFATASSTPARTIFWSESHLGSMHWTGFITAMARRWVLSRFREFAVPGQLAREYVAHHSPGAQIHYLPNLVDPALFQNDVNLRAADNTSFSASDRNGRRVLLIVSRLAEEKGLLPFLKGLEELSADDQSKLTVLIAGSGCLRRHLEQWMAQHSLDVRLGGQQTQSQLADLYARADGFCLPSIFDPNPISVIEALWAGLPLLLSSRVGNHPECLETGRNGFLFDVSDPQSIVKAISQWLSLSAGELKASGENSRQVARQRFDPDTVISNFLDELLPTSAKESESLLESANSR